MKKLFLLSLITFAFTFTTNAQDISDHAIGLRLGSNDGLGAAISYQHALSDSNRLEGTLGWRNSNNFSALKFTGLYQWVFPLSDGFNWYAGAGGGITSFSGKGDNTESDGTGFFIAGDIGVEYAFEIPLMLSLDFRPEIGNNNFTNNTSFDVALSVRYQF